MVLSWKPVDSRLSRKWLRKFSALASSLLPDLTFSYAKFLASFLIDQNCRTKVVPSAYFLVSISVFTEFTLVTPYYAVDYFILKKRDASKPWSGQMAWLVGACWTIMRPRVKQENSGCDPGLQS